MKETMTSIQNEVNMRLDVRSTASQIMSVPTVVLVVALVAAQHSAISHRASEINPRASTQLTSSGSVSLFDVLVDFHQRLASAQQDLPEDAARILRDNLWELYD
jgi:hypothetical protein